MKYRSKRLVLDVGSSAIRMCELTQTKTGFQLTKYYQRETLIDPATDEAERTTLRAEALRSLLKEAKVRTRRTVFGVPGQSVFVRNRPLPPVPEHKLTQIVKYEVQQQIPFSLDQIALDYQVLDRTEAGGYEVMMAAIKVDVVEKHLDVLRQARCAIDTVDVCPMAAYNWLKHTGEFGDQGECVALVDLGASTTDIVVERANRLRFTRSLNLGGNDVTLAIAASFGVGFAEAEKLKRERAFAPTGDPNRDGRGGEVVGQVLSKLVREVTRSFGYFRSQPGGGVVSRVIITGGGACLRNIVPYLQRELGVEVRIAQPLAGLAVAPGAQEVSERPEQAAVVLGLALRVRDTVPIELNLIPPRVREVARRKEQAFYWTMSLATLGLIMASSIPITAAKDNVVRMQIKTLQDTIAYYDPALATDPGAESETEAELAAVRSQVSAFVTKVKTLDEVRKQGASWLKYFKAINDARPEGAGVWISSVSTTLITDGPPQGQGVQEGLRGQQGAGAGYASTGFFGLSPTAARQESVSFGRQQEAGPAVPAPNGLIVYGYAQSPDVVTTYRQRLEASGVFTKVYFDDASASNVPMTVLYSAYVPNTFPGATGGGGVPQGTLTTSPYQQTVTSFKMEVRFDAPAAAPAPAPSQPPAPAEEL